MSTVEVLVYDLSKGMARMFSPMFLGTQIEAIYHSSIVVYGHEIYFGGNGGNGLPTNISDHLSAGNKVSGGTKLSQLPNYNDGIYCYPDNVFPQMNNMYPMRRIILGVTHLTEEQIIQILIKAQNSNIQGLGPFRSNNYELFDCNCNHFADVLAKILLDGVGIPEEVVGLPKKILSLPQGRALKQIIEGWLGNATVNGQRPKMTVDSVAGAILGNNTAQSTASRSAAPTTASVPAPPTPAVVSPPVVTPTPVAPTTTIPVPTSATPKNVYDPKVTFQNQPQEIQAVMTQTLLNLAFQFSMQAQNTSSVSATTTSVPSTAPITATGDEPTEENPIKTENN